MIDKLIREKGITKYRLAKDSGVPYSTVNDIISGKTSLEKCSAETVYKLAEALEMPMEDLLKPYMEPRISFELFKSNVCHRVKSIGDKAFILDTLKSNIIWEYYDMDRYPESLYLLGMLDYLSRINDIPQCEDFDSLRKLKFNEPIYPTGLLLKAEVLNDEGILKKAYEDSIPEFRSFNIIEGDIRNVI